MFISIFILLLPFLVIAGLPVIIKSFFSPVELDEMGVCLENFETSSTCESQQAEQSVMHMCITCSNI